MGIRDEGLTRRTRAIAAAQAVTAVLQARGVEVKIIGSLATNRFGSCSDVDLLICRCPRGEKYAIESLIEDCLDGLPFDAIYLDEIPNKSLARFTRNAVDASRLR